MIPQIQLQTTPIKIDYRTQPAKLEIQQPHAHITMRRTPIRFEVQVTAESKFTIDQTAAWQATGLGGALYFGDKIYSESKNILLQAIGKMVQEGNRIGDLVNGSSIADLHAGKPLEALDFNYVGAASQDNVSFSYQRKEIAMQFDPGSLEISTVVSPPQYKFTPHKVEFILRQPNSLEIIPPQIDLKL
jgi:hypothetical protein